MLLECIEIYLELFVIIIYRLSGDFICVKLLISTKLWRYIGVTIAIMISKSNLIYILYERRPNRLT